MLSCFQPMLLGRFVYACQYQRRMSLQAWWGGCDLRGSGYLKLRPPWWELVATLCANYVAELGPSHFLDEGSWVAHRTETGLHICHIFIAP